MRIRIPLLASALVLAIATAFGPVSVSAQSAFALYFNSDRTRITTVIIYNETSRPLSIGVNGGMDWWGDGDEGEASSLAPGDLTSLRTDFSTGDCIMIESESDDVSLAMSSDRDSVYVYANEGLDNGRVFKEK